MNKGQRVKIRWEDATSYYNLEEIPEELPLQETEGKIIKEKDSFVILKNPKTKNYNSHSHRGINKENKGKKPSFLFIPKGMIVEKSFID